MSDICWDAVWNMDLNDSFYPDEQVVRFLARYVARRDGTDILFSSGYDRRSKILDLGCGKGRHTRLLQDLALSAFGVDGSQAAIDVCIERKKSGAKSLAEYSEYSCQSMDSLSFDDSSFDGVICHGTLDHVMKEMRAKGIAEMARVSKTGCFSFVSLISTDDSAWIPDPRRHIEDSTIILDEGFEAGIPQAFFTVDRIYEEFSDYFEIISIELVSINSIVGRSLIGSDKDYKRDSRFYVTLRGL